MKEQEIKEYIIANTNIATIEDLDFMSKIPVDVCINLMKHFADHVLSDKMQELEDLRLYKKDIERILNDPVAMGEYLAGM